MMCRSSRHDWLSHVNVPTDQPELSCLPTPDVSKHWYQGGGNKGGGNNGRADSQAT